MSETLRSTSFELPFVENGNREVRFEDLGLMDFKEAWDLQESLVYEIVQQKIRNRNNENGLQEITKNHLLYCEHKLVFTLGKSGDANHLLAREDWLKQNGVTFHKINRGGDITHHGPRQITGYPILDLDNFFTDIHRYLRTLEEMIIRTLAEYGIEAGRLKGATGVWLDPENPALARKICAMGIRCTRWVTMHGFSFNINNDLNYFNMIVPCGIPDKQVTSLQKELDREIPLEEVKSKLMFHFSDLFNATLIV